MDQKKKWVCVIIAVVAVLITVIAIVFTRNSGPEKVEYVTYEFETFEGTTVKIDETNIITQKVEKDVLETTLVPENAEIIAPGRDYVYLEDDKYYYVEDVTKDLLTIATK